MSRTFPTGAALALLVAFACGPEGPRHEGDASLDARIRVSPTPAVVGVSRVFVVASDGSAPLSGGDVRLRAEAVDTASLGAAPPPSDGAVPTGVWTRIEAAADTPGGFGPVSLAFPAPGAWRIRVEVQAADGRSATIVVPLAVVGPPES